MSSDPYQEAFVAIETALDAGDDGALRDAIALVARHRTPTLSRAALQTAFRVVGRLFDAAEAGVDTGLAKRTAEMLAWTAQRFVEDIVTDREGAHRAYVQSTINRARAFQRPVPTGARTEPIPLEHRAIGIDEAGDLMQPYFRMMERRIAQQPYCHLPLAWTALEHPVPPFDTVFTGWLADLDCAGIGSGDSLPAIRRAMALARLCDERRQRVDPDTIAKNLLPQLADPNPMVAGCAGRFLGLVSSDPAFFVNRGRPAPLRDMLDHIAALPGARRPAAGGFLMGFADCEEPFHKLKSQDALEGYGIDDWVLRVLADGREQVYVPGAQAFWFYVHEGYCHDPAFIDRLIDAGHEGVALTTATEVAERVDGMRAVLERLAASQDDAISDGAARFLTRIWADA